jgi:hypothetical protein
MEQIVENRVRGWIDFARRVLHDFRNKAPYRGKDFELFYPSHYYELGYREGDRQITLVLEIRGPAGLWRLYDSWQAIYLNNEMRWDPPHDGEVLTDADKRRILSNLREAYNAKNGAVEFIVD